MANPDKKRDSGCPIAFGLDTFGDRWTLLVVRDLIFKGSATYGDFLAGSEKFATNILADRLKYLEAEHIITKNQDPENRRRFIYRLTEKGFDLVPLLIEMMCWSAKYDSKTMISQKILEDLANDRPGIVANLRKRFEKSCSESPAS